MKHFLLSLVVALTCLVLFSCAIPRTYSHMNEDLTAEHWKEAVHSHPNQWARHADKWFHTGNANFTEAELMREPQSAAVSMMNVKPTNFTKIQVDGSFQVQIVGATEKNGINIYGRNEDVRHVVVEMDGDTLYLSQDSERATLGDVIVRISITHLTELTQDGTGSIEGINIHSNGLSIESTGCGNVFLSGNMTVISVVNEGQGSINLFDIKSQSLVIEALDAGSVNVSGKVGLQSIYTRGSGDVNIIGAAGSNIKVNAAGNTKVGLNGQAVNLTEIKASGGAHVYGYNVRTHELAIDIAGKACVGLAGSADCLTVNANDYATFYGKSLCTVEASARAFGASHINFTSSVHAIASAGANASIYFFGNRSNLTAFNNGSGTIIHIAENPACCAILPKAVSKIRHLKGE